MRKKTTIFAILLMAVAIILPTVAFAVSGWVINQGVDNNVLMVGEYLSYDKTETSKGYIDNVDDNNPNLVIDLNEYANTVGKRFDVINGASITYTYETSASGDNAIKTGVITGGYSVQDNKLIIPENLFKANTGELYNDTTNQRQLSGKANISVRLYGYTGTKADSVLDLTAPITLVTKKFTKEEEFQQLYVLMTNDWMGIGDHNSGSIMDGTTEVTTTLRRWGGYFELGNNIIFNRQIGSNGAGYGCWSYNYGVDYSKCTKQDLTNKVNFTEIAWNKFGGFQGTFDGCGYAIRGIDFFTAQGLFGGINGHKGVIKNLALTNVSIVKHATEYKGTNVIAQNNYGTIENIFVQADSIQRGVSNNGSSLVSFRSYNTMKNIYVEASALGYTKTDVDADANLGSAHNAIAYLDTNATLTNAIAVTAGEDVYHKAAGGSYAVPLTDTTNNIYGYATTTDLKSASATIQSVVENQFDTTYWAYDTATGKPYFRKAFDTPNGNTTLLLQALIRGGNSVNLAFYNGDYDDKVTWSLKTPTTGITLNGRTISASLEAQKNAEVILIATYRDGSTREHIIYVRDVETLNPTAKAYLESDTKVTIDLASVIKELNYTSNITHATVYGQVAYSYKGVNNEQVTGTAFADYTFESTKVYIPVNKFTSTDGKQLSGEITATFSTNLWHNNQLIGNAKITANIILVTKVLRTSADIDGWYKNYAVNDWIALTQTVTAGTYSVRYGGYYELGNNITYTGTYQTIYNWFDGVSYWNSTGGFYGTFDGCGYVIDGFKMDCTTGMFGGVIGKRGVVKNLGFINAVQLRYSGNVLGQNLFGGTVENVFIHVKQLRYGSQPNGGSAFTFDVSQGATVKNVVAIVDSLLYDPATIETTQNNTTINAYTNIFGRFNPTNSTLTNMIAITAGEPGAYYDSVNNAEVLKSGTVYGYYTYNDAITDKGYSAIKSTFNTNLWTINAYDFPVFKSLSYLDEHTIETDYAYVGGSCEINFKDDRSNYLTTTWSTSTSGASFNGNVLTLDSTVGEFTDVVITASNHFGSSKSFTLTAVAPVKEQAPDQQVETPDATTEIKLGAHGTIRQILLDEKEVVNYEFVDSNDASVLSTITLARSEYAKHTGIKKLVVLTEESDGTYHETTVNLDFATMFISNKQELYEFSRLSRGNTWGVGELYVLDSDIDYEGDSYSINIAIGGANNTTGNGFAGTFDGRGHIIKNIHVTDNGFISGIRMDGVIKNVSFVNATQSSTGFFAKALFDKSYVNEIAGRVENVYLQVRSTLPQAAAFCYGNYAVARFKNVVVDVLNKSGEYYFYSRCYHANYGSMDNVYGINLTAMAYSNLGGNSGTLDKTQIFANYSALAAGGNDTNGNAISYAGMDNDFWDLNADGVPVPVALKSGFAPTITNTETTLTLNKAVAIEGNIPPYASFTASISGVTFAGNIMTVSDSAAGKPFTVTLTNAITGETAQKDFTTLPHTTYSLTADIDKIDATTTIKLPDGTDGEILNLTFNGSALTNYDYENESITLYSADYGTLGAKYKTTNGTDDYYTLSMRTKNANGEYSISVKVYVATMVITTASELYEFSQLSRSGLWGVGETYVLGADIDYYGKLYSINIKTNGDQNTTGVGFAGTFDGCGHIIKNIDINGNGFISGIRKDGYVQNISFMNAKQSGAGFISTTTQGGNVHNVYAQINSVVAKGAFFGHDNYGGARFNNVVVDVVSKTGTYYGLFDNYNKNYTALNGVYLVGCDAISGNTVKGSNTTGDEVQVFANLNAFKAGGTDYNGATINYATMDNDYWDIVEGVPVPAALAGKGIELSNATALLAGSETVLDHCVPYVTGITYEKVDSAVTMEGNTIIVYDDTLDGEITITVSSFVSTYSASKLFKIKSDASIVKLNAVDYDLNGATKDFAYNLNTVLNGATESDIQGITLDNKNFEYTIKDGALVINREYLNAEGMLGEHTIAFKVKTDDIEKTYKLPVIVCSKIITTKEEALNMLTYATRTNDDVANESVTGYFVLGADINVEDGWFGIGYHTGTKEVNPVYRATFDGRNHTISNPKYAKNASGLFGLARGCTVKNLKMVGVNVAYCGASAIMELAGDKTLIENVFVAGALTGGNPYDWGEQSLVVGKSGSNLDLTMNNVYTVLTSTNTTEATFTGTHFGEQKPYGTYNNCVGLNLTSLDLRLSYTGSTQNNSQVVTSKDDALALTGHSGSAWDAFVAYVNALE